MFSLIQKPINTMRFKIVARKLTILFAKTSRIMVTDTNLKDSIVKSIHNQECIPETANIDSFYDKKIFESKCKVDLLNSRSFDAAEKFKETNTCVLNFACSIEPGGGVLVGSVAQEECLCRSSTLYPCLNYIDMYTKFYLPHIQAKNDINNDDCIYTPSVTVFQTDELFPVLRERNDWFQTNVITCCAPALNRTTLSGKALYKIHYKRLCRILDIAASKKNSVVILGAFGCGAYKNDPHIVSKAMTNAIQHYRYVFKKIVFAIPSNDKRTNYTVFKKEISLNDF